MKQIFKFSAIILFIVIQGIQQAFCCSTFCLKDGQTIIFGRSYDWNFGYGYMMTNLRNIKKTRYPIYSESQASWTSKYGSVTFNQYGREYPIGGINETGLVVEVMTLDDIQYPNQDERTAIDELGWVQYQLDNSASIKDVIESDKNIRISKRTIAKLHFLITDKSGKTLIVEFLNGKASFYSDEHLPLPCLTNDTYSNSLNYLRKHRGFGGETPIDYQNHSSGNSLERFAIISDMLSKYKTNKNISIIDYSFDILDKVKDEKRSQFQVVYNIKQKKIYFRSLQSHQIKSVTLDSFNFDCASKPMMVDINSSFDGNINNRFIPYDSKTNKELVIKAYRETGINLPEKVLSLLAEWTDNLKCSD
ncbi:MAG: linear amide C-N hydrolase [Paludibacter sp.]